MESKETERGHSWAVQVKGIPKCKGSWGNGHIVIIIDAHGDDPESSKTQISFGKADLRKQGCMESIIEKSSLN